MAIVASLIGPVSKMFTTVLERILPENPEAVRKAQSELLQVMHGEHMMELEAAMKVIVAESQGGLLARNWRPIVMLTFTACVVAHWLGFTPDNLPPEQVEKLLDIVQLGLGGYVIGRSAEKIAPAIVQAVTKK